ncbi:MAG: hypothetical protein AB7P76_09105 [Candidatus Melainabacteria bacterium]
MHHPVTRSVLLALLAALSALPAGAQSQNGIIVGNGNVVVRDAGVVIRGQHSDGDAVNIHVQSAGSESPASDGPDSAYGRETVNTVSTGRDMSLEGTTVSGAVSAGRDVTGSGCAVEGAVSAGRSVSLNDCHVDHDITAGRDVTVTGGALKQSVRAGKSLTLNGVRIQGDVTSGSTVSLSQSTVNGTLTLPANPENPLKVDHSTVRTIRVTPNTGVLMMGGQHIRVQGSQVTSHNGKTMVRVGAGGVTTINGYSIQGFPDRTVVETPTGQTYQNGRASAEKPDPATYAGYRARHPEAPVVSGPGWDETTSRATVPTEEAPEKPGMTIELTGNSQVLGDITFEDGHGRVLVQPGSSLAGQVIGGTLVETDETAPH